MRRKGRSTSLPAKLATLPWGQHRDGKGENFPILTIDQAAKLFNVSDKTVKAARVVLSK
jgi:hypothetical protein